MLYCTKSSFSPGSLLQQRSKCVVPADEAGKGLHLQGRAHDDEEVTTREVLTHKGRAVMNRHISPTTASSSDSQT